MQPNAQCVMCWCCCFTSPDDGSTDDPKRTLLSPELPAKAPTLSVDKPPVSSQNSMKSKRKGDYKNAEPEVPSKHTVIEESCYQSSEQMMKSETGSENLPNKWNSNAAQIAANAFIGLSQRHEILSKTVDRTSELEEKSSRFKSVAQKLREKQAKKSKKSIFSKW